MRALLASDLFAAEICEMHGPHAEVSVDHVDDHIMPSSLDEHGDGHQHGDIRVSASGLRYYVDPPAVDHAHDHADHTHDHDHDHSHSHSHSHAHGHADHTHDHDHSDGEFSFTPLGEIAEGRGDRIDGSDLVASAAQGLVGLDDVPEYNSFPGAPSVLYLDFNGQIVTDTAWNADNKNEPIHGVAYDLDGDTTTFNQEELDAIYEIWARVSEDFMPFNINVTTVEPPAIDFVVGRGAMRAIITTNVDDPGLGGSGRTWFSNAGGVAFIDSWVRSGDIPVWVFYNALPKTPKAVAEASSHEFGHALGLSHDGRTGSAYYGGHGEGETGWAPIMGAGYTQEVTQWSKGEYDDATNNQDDLAIITRMTNRVTYRDDDHGAGPDATPVDVIDGYLEATGIIEESIDYDEFVFDHPGGAARFDVIPMTLGFGPNLDTITTLYDADGDEVIRVADNSTLASSISIDDLAEGTYYLSIEGGGFTPEVGQGYSDYASLGSYTVVGLLGDEVLAASAGGDYSIVEGASLQLDASRTLGVTDAAEYLWDVDGDGEFDDATGRQPLLTWDQLEGLTNPINDQGQFEIVLRVIDGNLSRDAVTTLVVTNAAPVASWLTISTAVAGKSTSFSISATDVESDPISVAWIFGSDAEPVMTNATNFDHVFPEPGDYEVTVIVSDDDGGETALVQSVRVTPEMVTVVDSPFEADLIVMGEDQSFDLVLSHDVSDSLDVASVRVTNQLTGAEVTADQWNLQWIASSNVLNLQLNGLTPGTYQITLADLIGDEVLLFDGDNDGVAGGEWSGDFTVTHAADANLDLMVDFADFLILSRQFGENGVNVADFDGDGVVGFSDFILLSASFGQSKTVLGRSM